MESKIVLRIKNTSDPAKVGGAIANYMQEYERVEIQAIGAGAVNQAVKAIATARGFVATSGVNLSCIPAFTDVDVEGETRTGIKFIVKEDN